VPIETARQTRTSVGDIAVRCSAPEMTQQLTATSRVVRQPDTRAACHVHMVMGTSHVARRTLHCRSTQHVAPSTQHSARSTQHVALST
jgi:hypothetical protein